VCFFFKFNYKLNFVFLIIISFIIFFSCTNSDTNISVTQDGSSGESSDSVTNSLSVSQLSVGNSYFIKAPNALSGYVKWVEYGAGNELGVRNSNDDSSDDWYLLSTWKLSIAGDTATSSVVNADSKEYVFTTDDVAVSTAIESFHVESKYQSSEESSFEFLTPSSFPAPYSTHFTYPLSALGALIKYELPTLSWLTDKEFVTESLDSPEDPSCVTDIFVSELVQEKKIIKEIIIKKTKFNL
jgi:hypothetical protein